MARVTILSLQIKLTAAATENEALRKQVLDLQKDLEIARKAVTTLRDEVKAAECDAPAPAPVVPGTWYAVVEADDDFGQPTARRVACASQAQAERLGDLGTAFVPASQAPAPKRTAYVMPAWQAERAAAMAKAKQAAMEMGCTVKV